MHNITVRKFPYPFKCAISICSDVDATPSLQRFLELQKFLCTNEQTSSGNGISLEIGNSFWFFRNSDHPGISYFDKLTSNQTEFAPYCRELIRTGFLDVLHSYGDFNSGGFLRKYAEISIDEIVKESLKIKTWVNHGNKLNSQNIGNLSYFFGSKSSSEHYHLDLLKQVGIKYFWISQITHLVGQNSSITFKNLVKNQLQKMLAIKYYKKQINPFFTNELMKSIILEDGNEIMAFMRYINPWGKYSYTDAKNLPLQLNERIIRELKKNEGYLILYTHLGNYANPKQILPEETCYVLRILAEQYFKGNIFITTTTRMLTYYDVVKNIKLLTETKDGVTAVHLNFKNNSHFKEIDLDGVTIYTDHPEKTEIYFEGKRLGKLINPPDYIGRHSVSVPWRKLIFPAYII